MKFKIGKEHRTTLLVIALQLLALIAVAVFVNVYDSATGTELLEAKLQIATSR